MFNLTDAMKTLEGRREFHVKTLNGYTIIDYHVALPDSFEGIRSNFRGIVFDDKGEIASLPFHKFFNVNEKPETQLSVIGKDEYVAMNKFDGSMIHALLVHGELKLATRAGWETQQAKEAMQVLQQQESLSEMKELIRQSDTPILEYCSPYNKIVLHYTTPTLQPLALRNRSTGKYQWQAELQQVKPLQEIHAYTQNLTYVEGFVCYNPLTYNVVKVKTPWYMARHRVVDYRWRKPYLLKQDALENILDDVIASCVEPEDASYLQGVVTQVALDKLDIYCYVNERFKELAHLQRREYVGVVKQLQHFPAFMLMYDKKDIESYVVKYLSNLYKEEGRND